LAYAAVRWITTNFHVSTGIDCFLAVMGVTLPRDAGYSGPAAGSTFRMEWKVQNAKMS